MNEVKAVQHEKSGNFLVYRSSAGSGKTFTLVLEYLKLALGEHENGYTEDYYKHILAVTFTNKAANEMKERVLMALKAIENNYSSLTSRDLTLADLLCKHLCIEYDVLQYRAKKCFAHMLHNYPLLGISTIDSFISRVVRTFSRDLKLNEGFNLSLNADDLANRAIRQLYRSVDKHNPEVASLVIEYVLQRLDDHQKPDWKSLLLTISGEMFKEKSSEYIKRITALEPQDFEDFKSILKAQTIEYRSQELALALACKKLVVDAGLTLTDLKSKSRGVGGWLEKVIIGKNEVIDKFKQDKYLQEEHYAMGCSADIKNRIMVFSEDFEHGLGLLFEHQNKGYILSVFTQSLLKNINLLSTIGPDRKI